LDTQTNWTEILSGYDPKWESDKMLKPKTVILLAFLLVMLVLVFYFDIGQYLNLEYFLAQREIIASHGLFSILLVIGLYVGFSFFHLPIAFLSIFSGYLFGFFWGAVVAYIGAVANILLAFIWARFLFRDFFLSLRNKVKIFDDITVKLNKNGTAFIFYARLFFLTPYNSLNIVCGISDIRFKDYSLASAAGSIVQAFFYSYVGSKIVDLMVKENMMRQGLTISIVTIGFFLALNLGKKYLQKKIELQ
jgi:uncharacterized membrane protein YdjX (TVP38/TMEM64 family)